MRKPEKVRVDSALAGSPKAILGRLGPGLITGASDDDPSGIGTYSQAGAQLGFGIGWTDHAADLSISINGCHPGDLSTHREGDQVRASSGMPADGG